MLTSGRPQNLMLPVLLMTLALLSGCTKTVPDIVGRTLDAATAEIVGAGLTLGAVTQAYSTTVASGTVVAQTPAGGTGAASGSAVALTVSQGPPPVSVPDVTGQTQTVAAGLIAAVNLSVGVVMQQCSNTAAAGLVISQVPAAGEQAPYGSAVALSVSTGFCPVMAPNLVGQTQAVAGGLLAAANLGIGVATQECSDTVAAGLVISQVPAAGEQAPRGGVVDLVVSTGPCPETIMLPGGVPLVMVWIPGGAFQMGRYFGEQDSELSEDPQHLVTLDGFWMAKYELTQRQWKAVMNSTPWAGYMHVLDDLDSPAVRVSWNDARSFLIALNGYTGKAFSLPSEAQWEYACRGGTSTRFYWGDDPSYTAVGNYVWYLSNSLMNECAHPVGQKQPNAFGLHDMCGNVWEWCEDDWHADYTNAPDTDRAWVDTPRGSDRVLRGGSWYGGAFRSAFRHSNAPGNMYYDIGFRVSRTP